jgi:hypothetical protein
VPLPGDALLVAHLSGSWSHVFGTGSLLEFEGSWPQDGGAVCHHMKIVDPVKQICMKISFMCVCVCLHIYGYIYNTKERLILWLIWRDSENRPEKPGKF